MEIDNQVQYASFDTTASFLSLHTYRACAQVGCMEVLPPGHTNSTCDRCRMHLKSFAKQQKSRHHASVAIDPAMATKIFGDPGMKARPEGWAPLQLNTSFGDTVRYRRRPSSQPIVRRHLDTSSSHQNIHMMPSHMPPKRPIRLPGAAVLAQTSYTFMPVQTAASHFNSRGELIAPPPPTQQGFEPRHSLSEIHPFRPCARCRKVLLPGHGLNLCASCYATSHIPLHQSMSMEYTPIPNLLMHVSSVESHDDGPKIHTTSVLSPAKKCSEHLIKPAPSVDRPVPSVVPDPLNDTAIDSDIDIDVELSYPEPLEILSKNRPLKCHEPTDDLIADLEPQVAITKTQEVPTPSKPKLSICIPHDSHPQITASTRDFVSIVPSQDSTFCSDRTCSTQGCGERLQPDAASPRCFRCLVKTWRMRHTKSDSDSDRLFVKKSKKSVSWADEVGGNLECVERRLDHGNPPACPLPSPSSSVSLDTDNKDIEEDAVIKQLTLSDSAPLSDAVPSPRLTRSPEPIITGELETISTNNPPLSESNLRLNSHSPTPGRNPPPSCDPKPLSTSTIYISGWNSDLTDLSEDESDADSSSDSKLQPSGLKIRIPARPRPPDRDVPQCTIKSCQAPLSSDHRWKCCAACRIHYRTNQRNRLGIQGKRHGKYSSSRIRDYRPPSTTRLPSPPLTPLADKTSSKVVPGARFCSVRSCAHVLPSASEYCWKLCGPCRTRMRRKKTEVAVTVDTGHGSQVQQQECSGDESEDLPLAVALRHRTSEEQQSSRCSSTDCGMLLDLSLSRLECPQCAYRKLRIGHGKIGQGRDSQAAVKPSVISPYPQYKCLSALLSAFKSRFISFLKAHSYYFLAKLAQGVDHPNETTIFGFDGEFSVVALDFNILDKREEMAKNAHKFTEEIERLCGLQFGETWISTNVGGLVRRFACSHEVPSIAPTPVTSSSDIKTRAKTMHGELEVAIFPDHSHHFFAGRRTIVRFCLVG